MSWFGRLLGRPAAPAAPGPRGRDPWSSTTATGDLGLFEAVERNDVETVARMLVRADFPDINPNYRCPENLQNTPMTIACLRGFKDIATLLLARDDLDLTVGNVYLSSPLHLACLNGLTELVEMLLHDSRVPVNLEDVDGSTPLWDAAYHGHVGPIKWLIASGRTLNPLLKGKMLDIDPNLTTPYEIALKHRFSKAADLIKEFETNPVATRARIRAELNVTHFPVFNPIQKRNVVQTFALVLLVADGFLSLPPRTETKPAEVAHRFLSIASRLPMELQMVLANRMHGSRGDLVPSADLNELLATKWGFE